MEFNVGYRVGLSFICFLSVLAVSFVSVSLGTDRWVWSSAVRLNGSSASDLDSPQFSFVHFGLFSGERVIDTGALGLRRGGMTVWDEISMGTLSWAKGLWITLVVFTVVSCLFGCVTIVVSLVNCLITPVSPLLGRQWLFLWPTVAGVAGIIATILAVVSFAGLQSDFLLPEHKETGWTTKGLARLDFSFWLFVTSAAVHLAAVIVWRFFVSSSVACCRRIASSKSTSNDANLFMY